MKSVDQMKRVVVLGDHFSRQLSTMTKHNILRLLLVVNVMYVVCMFWPVGKHGLDSGLDWTGLGGGGIFFWRGGRIFNLSPTCYIFSFGGGRG